MSEKVFVDTSVLLFSEDGARPAEREQVPDACSPMIAQLESLRARQRYAEIVPLAHDLVLCDAQNNALYNVYLEQRDFESAKKELARLPAEPDILKTDEPCA